MTADYADLEARVTELEHQARNVLPQKIDAVAYGLSLVHQDVREIRRTQDEHGLLLADHGEQLGAIRGTLAEILRRLPPPAE